MIELGLLVAVRESFREETRLLGMQMGTRLSEMIIIQLQLMHLVLLFCFVFKLELF